MVLEDGYPTCLLADEKPVSDSLLVNLDIADLKVLTVQYWRPASNHIFTTNAKMGLIFHLIVISVMPLTPGRVIGIIGVIPYDSMTSFAEKLN